MTRRAEGLLAALFFTAAFTLLSLLLEPFQLRGMTDYGFWLSAFSNFVHHGDFSVSVLGGHSYAATPLPLLLSPLFLLTGDPEWWARGLFYLTFLSWYMAAWFLFPGGPFLKKAALLFAGLFGSATVLFHYDLNYNGWQSVLLSVPFLAGAYYLALAKGRYPAALLLFVPLLLLKVEFWLLFLFFLTGLWGLGRDRRYLLGAAGFLLLFALYLGWFLPSLGNASSMLGSRFGHIFGGEGLWGMIAGVFHTPALSWRWVPMLLFFLPFLPLLEPGRIPLRARLFFFWMLAPTLFYCLLSAQVPMSYWTHEHYVMPVLGLVLAYLAAYGRFTLRRMGLYLLLNAGLAAGIIATKQPWQFRAYQDEARLKTELFPLMEPLLEEGGTILTEDRTGFYLTPYRLNYLRTLDEPESSPDLVLLNLRYQYSAENLLFRPPAAPRTGRAHLERIAGALAKKGQYGVLYADYPFILFARDRAGRGLPSPQTLEAWDRNTREANRWIR